MKGHENITEEFKTLQKNSKHDRKTQNITERFKTLQKDSKKLYRKIQKKIMVKHKKH